MKKLYTLLLLVCCFLHAETAFGQDMHFTQFYAAPVYLNPAFTGANTCARVALLYRIQWQGFSNPYRSYMLSFDHYLFNKHIGLGFIVAEDVAGAGNLKNTLIKPSFAYGTRINKRYTLRFGLQPGVGIRSLNYSNLLFGDQIYRGGGSVATVETIAQSKLYFDLSAGILITGSRFWGGISAYHLNGPNESLLQGTPSLIPVQLSFQTGIKLQINKDERDVYQKKYFTPVLNYARQNKYDQLDIGFYFTRYIFTVGLWYRGLPLLKAYRPGYQNNDALAIIAGVQTERIKVGYSYDRTISKLAGITKGAHEVTLSFQMCNPKTRKTKFELISCPKF